MCVDPWTVVVCLWVKTLGELQSLPKGRFLGRFRKGLTDKSFDYFNRPNIIVEETFLPGLSSTVSFRLSPPFLDGWLVLSPLWPFYCLWTLDGGWGGRNLFSSFFISLISLLSRRFFVVGYSFYWVKRTYLSLISLHNETTYQVFMSPFTTVTDVVQRNVGYAYWTGVLWDRHTVVSANRIRARVLEWTEIRLKWRHEIGIRTHCQHLDLILRLFRRHLNYVLQNSLESELDVRLQFQIIIEGQTTEEIRSGIISLR